MVANTPRTKPGISFSPFVFLLSFLSLGVSDPQIAVDASPGMRWCLRRDRRFVRDRGTIAIQDAGLRPAAARWLSASRPWQSAAPAAHEMRAWPHTSGIL